MCVTALDWDVSAVVCGVHVYTLGCDVSAIVYGVHVWVATFDWDVSTIG